MVEAIEEVIKHNPYFRQSRLNSLYSNFDNLKHLNPEGYEANIEAWSNLLICLMRQGKIADSTISIPSQNPSLFQFLSIPIYGRPESLGTILDELVNAKVLIPLSVYENVNEPYFNIINKSEGMAAYLLPGNWLKWGLASIGLSGQSSSVDKQNKLVNDRYISWDLLNELGTKYFTIIEDEINRNGNYSGKLFNNSTLYDLLKSKVNITLIDFRILLTFWSRDLKKCQITTIEGITYIKFDFASDIDNVDIGIVNLKSNILSLSNRNCQLENKIQDIENELKLLVKTSSKEENKNKLRNLIKLKKTLIDSLSKSFNSISQLNLIMIKINDANLNNEIYNQLLTSSRVLSTLNSKVNLNEIDDLKIELDEEIEKTYLITESLIDTKEDVEIDEELNKLYNEAVEKKVKSEEDNKVDVENEKLLQRLDRLKLEDTKLESKEIPSSTLETA